jgi:Domain of unknown function (DUF3330)
VDHNHQRGCKQAACPDTKENTMTKNDKPVELESVACEICLKEIPSGEAQNSETVDYVAHFCGLECYEKWMSQDVKPENPGEKPGEQIRKSGT